MREQPYLWNQLGLAFHRQGVPVALTTDKEEATSGET